MTLSPLNDDHLKDYTKTTKFLSRNEIRTLIWSIEQAISYNEYYSIGEFKGKKKLQSLREKLNDLLGEEDV